MKSARCLSAVQAGHNDGATCTVAGVNGGMQTIKFGDHMAGKNR
jgi:hypothetical protein